MQQVPKNFMTEPIALEKQGKEISSFSTAYLKVPLPLPLSLLQEDLVRQVLEEMKILFEQNQKEV